MSDHVGPLAQFLTDHSSETKLRIAKVTGVDSDNSHVQLDATGSAWQAADSTDTFNVGDRVYALQSGPIWVVVGRLGGGGGMPVGSLILYGGSSSAVPSGWLICDGAELSRTTYAKLFAVIGTEYGAGDGSTTFNLPHMLGRFPVGVSAARPRGTIGGASSVTLTLAQIPAHNHGSDGAHTHTVPNKGTDQVADGTTATVSDDANSGTHTSSSSGSHTHNTEGGGQAHENMPPFVAFYYLMKAM